MKNEMLECPLDTFLEHYLPFSPSTQWVKNALQYLKHTGELVKLDKTGSYKISPSKINNQRVVKRLESIFGKLSEVGCPDDSRKRGFHYRSSNFKADGIIAHGLTASDKGVPISEEIGVTMEFKKNKTYHDILDNCKKLVSGVSRVMDDDPRRGWMYDHNVMSLWYFSRSHSVKSKGLDFTKDIEICVRVFLSLLYATPEELGYDETIHRVRYDKKWCYVYELGTKKSPRYFRTIKQLHNPSITGRNSRIWKVIEVEGPSDEQLGKVISGRSEVILKDGWLDEGSLTEKEIQEAIFDRLDQVSETDYAWATGNLKEDIDTALEDYRHYFMGIDHDRLLEKTKPVVTFAKPAPGLFEAPEYASAATVENVIPGSMQMDPSWHFPVRTEGQNATNEIPRKYQVKRHYRLVYNEAGYPLHLAPTLVGSISAVCDSFIALVLLYLARWVHRDVTTQNIILVKERDGTLRGKLRNLEYAQDFDEHRTVSHDPKAGTPYFMPLEIHRGWRFYYPPQKRRTSHHPDNSKSLPHVPNLQTNPRKTSEAPLRFIFPHDVESLFWIIVWILLCRVKYEPAHELGALLFTDSALPSRERENFFLRLPQQHLQDKIHPTLQHIAPEIIENICATLFEAYRKDTIPEEELIDMYLFVWSDLDSLNHGFRTLGQEAPKLRTPSSALDDPFDQAEAPKKRQRKPEDDDEYMEGTGTKGMNPSKKSKQKQDTPGVRADREEVMGGRYSAREDVYRINHYSQC